MQIPLGKAGLPTPVDERNKLATQVIKRQIRDGYHLT